MVTSSGAVQYHPWGQNKHNFVICFVQGGKGRNDDDNNDVKTTITPRKKIGPPLVFQNLSGSLGSCPPPRQQNFAFLDEIRRRYHRHYAPVVFWNVPSTEACRKTLHFVLGGVSLEKKGGGCSSHRGGEAPPLAVVLEVDVRVTSPEAKRQDRERLRLRL